MQILRKNGITKEKSSGEGTGITSPTNRQNRNSTAGSSLPTHRMGYTRIETERAGRHLPRPYGIRRGYDGCEGRTNGAAEGVGDGAPGED